MDERKIVSLTKENNGEWEEEEKEQLGVGQWK